MPRAHSASTSTRCAAAAASAVAAGRARLRRVRQARDHVRAGAPDPGRASPRRRTVPQQGLAADRRLACTARLRGDLVIDVPPESQVHRQVVRKGLPRATSRSTRSSASTTWRSPGRTSRRPPATSAGCSTPRARVGPDRPASPTSRSSGRSSRRSRAGRYRGHGRGPRRTRRHRGLAGPPRPRVRRRHRRRVDDDRRPSRRT